MLEVYLHILSIVSNQQESDTIQSNINQLFTILLLLLLFFLYINKTVSLH